MHARSSTRGVVGGDEGDRARVRGNDAERPQDLVSAEALVVWHDDVLAHGGNVLLNVGLTAAGTVPSSHRGRLDALSAHVRQLPASRT